VRSASTASFPLKSATDKKIIFKNPKHDFLQRIIYWREGDKLCARRRNDAGERGFRAVVLEPRQAVS